MVIRLACVGAGWAVRTIWLPLIRDLPHWTAAGIADPDPDPDARAAAVAVCPGMRQAETVEALLDQGEADIVLIASPNLLHVPHTEAALRAGCGVIVEKPVCFTAAEAARLVAVAETAGRPLWVSRATVERRDVAILHDQVAAGAVGPVHAVDLSWLRASGVPRVGTWFTRRVSAGGGVLADLGWHMLDVGLGLLGHPPPVAAQCVLHRDTGPLGGAAGWLGAPPQAAEVPWPPGAVDVETRAHGSLTLAGGGLVRLSVAWQSHAPRDICRVTVNGRDGSLDLITTFGFSPVGVEHPSLTLTRRGQAEDLTPPREDVHAPYRRFLTRVAEDVAAGRLPGAAALTSVAASLEALYAAASWR